MFLNIILTMFIFRFYDAHTIGDDERYKKTIYRKQISKNE